MPFSPSLLVTSASFYPLETNIFSGERLGFHLLKGRVGIVIKHKSLCCIILNVFILNEVLLFFFIIHSEEHKYPFPSSRQDTETLNTIST